MIKALFFDFYGTIVHEDGAVVDEITTVISSGGDGSSKSIVGGYWRQVFQELYVKSFGENFKTQRELEIKSLEITLEKFGFKYGANDSAYELSQKMFNHWRMPAIFKDAAEFLVSCRIPYYFVSNTDTDDITAAIACHGLSPAGVFTSEKARSYKPRPEIYEMALKEANLTESEVIHIGDSLSSDVAGASALGIGAVWINRSNKKIPDGIVSVSSCTDIFNTPFLLYNQNTD